MFSELFCFFVLILKRDALYTVFIGMLYSLIEQRLANLKPAGLQMLFVKSCNWMIVHQRPYLKRRNVSSELVILVVFSLTS